MNEWILYESLLAHKCVNSENNLMSSDLGCSERSIA